MLGIFEFNPNDKGFVADYNAAWKIVSPQLKMDKDQLKEIKGEMRQIFNKGISQIYREMKSIFDSKPWKWDRLDEYIAIFRACDKMPYMLDWAGKHNDISLTPSIDEALTWFTVAELKKYCKYAGIPSSGKREDIENLIKGEGNFLAEWQGEIFRKYEVKKSKKDESERRDRAEILIHYVIFLCYAQEKIRIIKDALARNPDGVVIFTPHHDEGEKEFYKNISSIDDHNYPPFFPGDRTGLMFIRKREQVPADSKIVHTPW